MTISSSFLKATKTLTSAEMREEASSLSLRKKTRSRKTEKPLEILTSKMIIDCPVILSYLILTENLIIN